MTGGWLAGVSCDTASQATTWRRRSARGAQVGRRRAACAHVLLGQ